MSRKKRVVITFIVVEGLLAALWYWMHFQRSIQDSHPGSITVSHDAATVQAQQVIGSTMGMAMGAVAGFFVLLFFLAAKTDRDKPKP